MNILTSTNVLARHKIQIKRIKIVIFLYLLFCYKMKEIRNYFLNHEKY